MQMSYLSKNKKNHTPPKFPALLPQAPLLPPPPPPRDILTQQQCQHQHRHHNSYMPPLLLLCLHNNKLRTRKEEDQENQLTLLLKFRLRKCLLKCAQGQKFNKQFYLYKLALFKLFLTSLSLLHLPKRGRD